MKFNFKLDLKGVNPQKIRSVQIYIDNEVLRRSDPLVPMKTGMLKKSGINGTSAGSGVIRYSTPYAKMQYFRGKSSNQRGRLWMRRMWTAEGKDILRHAQEILNGE
ncbi:MAG: minor capsid protein [Ruminococcus sp.]|nr:minor capsid protein [Ruminococcus sp.]